MRYPASNLDRVHLNSWNFYLNNEICTPFCEAVSTKSCCRHTVHVLNIGMPNKSNQIFYFPFSWVRWTHKKRNAFLFLLSLFFKRKNWDLLLEMLNQAPEGRRLRLNSNIFCRHCCEKSILTWALVLGQHNNQQWSSEQVMTPKRQWISLTVFTSCSCCSNGLSISIPDNYLKGSDEREARQKWELTLKWRHEERVDSILSEPPKFFELINSMMPTGLIPGKDRNGHLLIIDRLYKFWWIS